MQVDWSKYPLSQKDWEYFATLDRVGRRKWLKGGNHEGLILQYQRNEVPRCEVCSHAFFHCVCGDQEYAKKKAKWQAELNKSFEDKLRHSEELVEYVLEKARKYHLKLYLAYSGGIDSECCLQLFKKGIIEGLITVIVGNTTTELPDTYRRWKEAEAEFEVKFIYALPERGVTFKSNSIKYGLAIYPRNSQSKTSGSEAMKIPTKRCCGNLKERPQQKLMKDMDGVILGLKATESQGRMFSIKKNGDCFFSSKGKWNIKPIAYWTIEDEWTFQKLRLFKYNTIYDRTNCGKTGFYKLSTGKLFQIRSGCAFCPQGIHSGYLEWLKEYYPNWYHTLIKIYNEVAQVRGDGMNFIQILIIKKKMKLKEQKEQPCGEKL